MRRDRTSLHFHRQRVLLTAMAVLLACSESPTSPAAPTDNGGLGAPPPSFAVFVDPGTTPRGTLLDEVSFTTAASADTVEQWVADNLFLTGQVQGAALLEISGQVTLGTRSLPVGSVLGESPIYWYTQNGDAYYRNITASFRAIRPGEWPEYQYVIGDPAGNPVTLVDSTAGEHGLEVVWNVQPPSPLGWNANDPADPDECRGILINLQCDQAPPFGPETTSETAPTAAIVVRAFRTNTPPLTCTPVVERGQQVTCALSLSENVTITGWDFTPSAGGLPPVQDTSTSPEWKGVAAVGGVARVHVTDGTTQQTFESSFAVTDRTSPWAAMQTYRQGPEQLVPDVEPQLNVTLGRNCPEVLLCVPTLRVQPDPRTSGAGYTSARILSGPNKEYWYVVAQTWNMKRIGNVNPAILPGSPRTHPLRKKVKKACRQALGFGPNVAVFANFYEYNDKCANISMSVFVDAVWGHEGFGYNGGQGHESLARTAAAEPQNDPYTAIEALVYADSASLESVVRSKVVPIAFDVTQRSDDPLPTGNRSAGPIWFWDSGPAIYSQYNINGF